MLALSMPRSQQLFPGDTQNPVRWGDAVRSFYVCAGIPETHRRIVIGSALLQKTPGREGRAQLLSESTRQRQG
jgi:hypothetical protein